MNWMNSSQPFDPLIYRVAMSDTFLQELQFLIGSCVTSIFHAMTQQNKY